MSMPPLHIPAGILAQAAQFRSHPALQAAVRLNAEEMLSFYEGQPLLNHLVSEEARWLIGGFIFYLHFTREPNNPDSGATTVRVQQLCAEYQVASPGRVAALIALMRLGGYVRQVPSLSDGRLRLLEPTESMLDYSRRWLSAHLGAIALLSSRDDYRALHASDPAFLGRVYREAGRLFLAGDRILEAVPEIRHFMDRDAGYMILLRLWLSDTSSRLPPVRASLPYGTTGPRFGVSRAHVRKLMEAAARRDLLRLHAEGGHDIEILPALVDIFEQSLCLQLANLAHCARVAAQG